MQKVSVLVLPFYVRQGGTGRANSGHHLFSTDHGIAAATGSNQRERRVQITTNYAVAVAAAPNVIALGHRVGRAA
jgi:hypothetical protein